MTLPFLQQGSGPVLVGPSDTEESTGEDSANPVTYTASALTDQWGYYWMVEEEGDESAAASEGTVGLSGSMQTVLTSGLRNADFAQGPAEPDRPIDDTNPLPYWTFTRVQGSIDAHWVADSSAPSGYAVEWSVHGAETDDEAYLEQIMPVGARTHVLAPIYVVGPASAATSSVVVTSDYQPLAYDGTPVGTGWTKENVEFSTYAGPVESIVGIPDTARYLRVRVGVKAAGAYSGNATRNLREMWAGTPRTVDVTLTGSDTTLPTTGSQAFYPDGGNENGHPDSDSLRLVAPGYGWLSSISANLHDTLNGGDIQVSVRNVTALDNPGDPAAIAEGSTYGYATSVYDATDNVIVPGDLLRFATYVSSGTVSSYGRDLHVIAVLTFVVPGATSG